MSLLLILVVFATGVAIAFQPMINAGLAANVGNPLSAALISVTVTYVFFVAAVLWFRAPSYLAITFKSVPPWAYLGGVIGACIVFAGIMAIPKLGVATAIALLIAGQLTGSMLADHYGLFGMAERPLSFGRVSGAVMLFLGAVTIKNS